MSIAGIGIPIRADSRSLSTDLGGAYAQIQTFARKAEAPVSVSLDLSPLKEHAAQAVEIAGRAAAGVASRFARASVIPKSQQRSVGASVAGAAMGLAIDAAAVKLGALARKASLPMPLRLDLAPLKADAAKAVAIAAAVAKSVVTYKVTNFAAKKVGGALGVTPASNNLMAGREAVNQAAPHAAAITVAVGLKALKLDLDASVGLVRGSFRVMKFLAVLPLRATSFGVRVGLGAAESLMVGWVQKKTGWSTVELLAKYAKLKLTLGVAQILVKGAAGAMGRAAVFPLKVSLGLLKSALAKARAMVAETVRSIAGVAKVPFSPLAVAAGGVAALALAGGLIVHAVKSASDLNETVSKVGYTFGASASLVTDSAEEMAKRFGTVKATYLEGAAGIGLIGKAAGKSDAEAAKLGVEMTRLAQDLTSFANIPFDSALEKIRSGLVGEAEPLRAVGVLLNEDAVKAKAAAMGFGALHGKLSEGVKVMARAALITEGLATASGDLSRTSGDLANSVRGLWGRMQNLSAEMGTFLLPAAKSLSAAFGAMAVDAADAVGKYKKTFEAWGESLKNVADYVGIIYRNLGDVKSIAGMMFGDVAAYLGDSIKAGFENAVEYAKYFANVLGQSIERGIQNGLHAAFEGNALLKRFDPGAYKEKVVYTPPTEKNGRLKTATYKQNTGIDQVKERVAAKETARGVTERAKEIGGKALNALGAFQGMTRGALGSIAARDKTRADRLNAGTAFMANNRAGFDAPERKVTRLPKGFSTESARLGLAPGATQLEKKRARTIPPADQAVVNAQAKAMALGGALGAIGGFGAMAGLNVATMTAKQTAAPLAHGPTRFAGAAEKGSREEYSAIIRFAAGGNKNPEKVGKQQLDQLKEIVKNTKPKFAPGVKRQPSAVPS